MNIHGIFFVKDATMVEKQKQAAVAEVPEAMETDPVTSDVQLPDVEKMADKGEGSKTVTDGGETAPEPEESMNDDPAPAEEEKSSEGSSTDLNEANGKEGEKAGATSQKDKVLLYLLLNLSILSRAYSKNGD